jgi:hypothetical protein
VLYFERPIYFVDKIKTPKNILMSRQDPIICLWRKNNRRGPAIPRKSYNEVASKIISELESNTAGEIDLLQFIDHIRYTLSSSFSRQH